MAKQIPNWLFGVIIAGFTLGFIGLLGSAMKPASSTSTANGAPGVMTGKVAPNFSGETTEGKTLHLSDYKGKVVLVNFWATWCGPCRMEIPDLIKLQDELGPKGFTVIGMSGDDSLATADAFAKEQKMTYPILLSTSEIMTSFGSPSGIPASFLIDQEGKIVWAQEGIDPNVSMYSVLKPMIQKQL